jgi:hypothetical protein
MVLLRHRMLGGSRMGGNLQSRYMYVILKASVNDISRAE